VLQAIPISRRPAERDRTGPKRSGTSLKNAATGRSGLTPQQVLRSLVLMRVKNWDYRELRSGSPTAIRCASSRTSIPGGCRGMTHSPRLHSATPATLKAINELVVRGG